jgi:DNA-binding CsgD family transcriptional regulator
VGKSTLLAYAVERATDMRVLRAVGIEAESELPFAALHQILRPVLDRVERLPGPQADALRSAFGLSTAATGDRFLIAVGVLSLLAEAADERPLLCVVDDAQWLDKPSADAIAFVARRLDAEPVALLCAARDDGAHAFPAEGLAELHLDGLDRRAADTLLATRLGAAPSPALRDVLVERTGGNPLALIELSRSLTADQMAGREALREPLPIGDALEDAFLARVRELPERTQTVLLLAAADDSGDPGIVLRGAEALGIDADSLDPAETAGLLRVSAGALEFGHPLVRSAIYRKATFGERRAAHTALADALVPERDADRRAWHRAAATTPPDEDVAGELEASGTRAHARGGYAAASAALERAAELSAAAEDRARRLSAAALNAWRAGGTARAVALLDQASGSASDPHLCAEIEHYRGVFARDTGSVASAISIHMAGATAIGDLDPAMALQMLGDAAGAAEYAGDPEQLIQIGRRAASISSSDGEEIEFASSLLQGIGGMLEESPRGPDLLRRAVALGSHATDRLLYAALAASYLGDVVTERALAERAVAQLRAVGVLGTMPVALELLAAAELWSGNVRAAEVHASEGLRLAREMGQESSIADFLACLAGVAAVQGREEECRAHAAEAIDRAGAGGLGLPAAEAAHALAFLDLGLGRPQEGFERLERLVVGGPGLRHPRIARLATPTFVESAALVARPDATREAFGTYERWVERTGSASLLPLLERCRAFLASGEDAERHLSQALGLHRVGEGPFEHARTQLLYGEALRRHRKRVDARVQLRAALDTFEQLGAAPWEERARRELRASGETARKRDPSTIDELTPQELQIARLVGDGATNRQIAGQLFLSTRTIDYHVRKIFVKLGISSRVELIRLNLG